MRRLAAVFLAGCGPDPSGPAAAGKGSDAPAAADTAETSDTGTDAEPDCAPPDADPPPTAAGHPTDGWRWHKHGPLFEDTVPLAYTEGDLSPTVVDTGAGLHLLFTRQEGTSQALWASTSPDGVAWTEPVAVSGLEPSGIEYPSLAYVEGTFHLWYGSGSVDYATSADGFTFTPGGTVLRASEAGDFASLSLLYPHAVVHPDGVELWYTGFDGARFAIGTATSTAPGEPFTGPSLVLAHDPDGWDNTSVAMPMVVDGTHARQLWYGGYDTVIADPGPWRVGRLDPDTGARQISLPLAESGPDAWSTRDPSVVRVGDGWRMVYVGMGDDGVYRLMAATSDVCP